MILGSDGEKMSKSRGNVINPDDVVQEHGADALRLYEMFMGPLEAVKPWQTNQLIGVVRFRDRVYSLLNQGLITDSNHYQLSYQQETKYKEIFTEMHKTIKKVTQDIERLSFNTAISALMVYSNKLQALQTPIPQPAYEALILCLSPFAPHIAEECWQLIGKENSLAYQPWPMSEEQYCIEEMVTIAVQVNGKVRGKIDIQVDWEESKIQELALQQVNVQKFIDGKPLKKVLYVPSRILNILI
jgi:leucyl-tRNA synthetase